MKTKIRMLAVEAIAAFHFRSIACMADLKPVKTGKCDGPLEIDHIFGAGKRDSGYRMYKAIVDGKRDLSYFRILCRKHNRQRTADWGQLTLEGMT